jgi:hypothetical protein
MLACGGEYEEVPAVVDPVRKRIAGRVPFLAERCRRLLRLAELGARGPDPEAALEHLAAAQRSLSAFLALTKMTAVLLVALA